MADQYDPYQYLLTFDGDPGGFLDRKGKRGGQRLGQAFFNSVNENDRWILQHGPHDPFHSDNREDVRNAVKYLLNFGS